MTALHCVAVAVSGGADSLYALARLSQQVPKVIALHGLFLPYGEQPSPEGGATEGHIAARTAPGVPATGEHNPSDSTPVTDDSALTGLRTACARLGVELHVIDIRAAFDTAVVLPFLQAYLDGHTPNPCAHCNAQIKFGALWEAARALGADTLATGHYAALEQHPVYGLGLRQGQDEHKDQSYFLSLVPMEHLRHALFPLAHQRKAEAIAYVHSLGLQVPVPKESQDICFVPQNLDKGYRTFMQTQASQRGLTLGATGPMCLPDGRTVGRHQGLWQYTQGQRRGLGVAHSEPLYVTGKDRHTNTLYLGTHADCQTQDCHTAPANLLVAPELWPQDLRVRIRYRQHTAPATVRLHTNNRLHIHFAEQQQASASGQIATIYDTEGFVLAGAVIV